MILVQMPTDHAPREPVQALGYLSPEELEARLVQPGIQSA